MYKRIIGVILAAIMSAIFAPAFAQAPPPVPALPDAERRTVYSLVASTCACSLNFAIYQDGTDVDSWIEVWISGVRYLSTDVSHGWAITSATGSLATIPRPITNAVLTFTAVQTGTLQIVGAQRPRRLSQFAENRGVAARDLNQVITGLTAQNRETWDKINDVTGRSLVAPPGDTLTVMPSAAARASQLLGFDSSGNPLLYAPSAPTTIISAVNILAYGAIGDGSIANATVNTTALTTALATGKCVYIPHTASGYHFGTNQITVGNGGCIIGEAQVKIISTAATSWLYLVGSNWPVTQISNLWIDMTGSGASSTAIRLGTNTISVFGVRISEMYFTNVVEAIGDETHATNFTADVVINDVRSALTRGTQIHFRRSRGFTQLISVQVDNTSNAGAVTWNSIQFDAIAGIELHGVDVTGPTSGAYQAAVYGIQITGNAPSGYNAVAWLDRVDVDTSTGNGIKIDTVNYIWAHILDVNNNLGHQIVMSNCTKAELTDVFAGGAKGTGGAFANANGITFDTCSNIHAANVSTENNTQHGFNIASTTDSQFVNIRSQGNTGTGFLESGTSDRNVVSGANFSTNGTDVTLTGANSRFGHYIAAAAYVPWGVNAGGTGATTAATARTNLGVRQIVSLTSGTGTQAQNTTQFQTSFTTATENNVKALCPFSGTFKNLFVESTAPAGGQTLTAIWRVNGADTAVTCTITGAATTCSDTTHSAACTAGQSYSLKTQTSATSGTMNFIAAGIELDP